MPIATPIPTPTPVPTPSATPLAIATDSVFASIGSGGVDVFSQTGTLTDTFATSTGADYVGLDSAANAYILVTNNFVVTIARYAIGTNSPNAGYTPTSAMPQLILVGTNGTLVAAGAGTGGSGNATAIYDIWDPGVTGAPSRTLTYPNETLGTLGGAVASDGTFYVPYDTASGQIQYDVIPPGSSTPSRTIAEQIATAGTNFTPNVMDVASDGTLYVGEWTYEGNDTNTGLYIYETGGNELKASSGAPNPTGLDFDNGGNVYVANSNATLLPDSTLSTDTAHTLSVYAPLGTTPVRSVSSGLDDPQNLAVDLDGTAYLAEYENADQAQGSIVVAGPSATAATTFAGMLEANDLVLFDGTRVRSYRPGTARGHSGASRALRLRRTFRRRIRGNRGA